MRNAILTAVVAVLGLAIVVAGVKNMKKAPSSKNGADKTAAIPVSTVVVSQRDLNETVDVTGTLKPANEVTVATRYSGEIIMIAGKAGTVVKKGDIVARLDDADAQTQLASARAAVQGAKSGILNAKAALDAAIARERQSESTYKAQKATAEATVAQATQALNAAQSRLNGMLNGSRSQEKQIAENNVKLSEATYKLDKRNYETYKDLYEKGAVSRTMLESYETKMNVSEAQLNSAKQQADMVNKGPRQEDIGMARAAVDQAKAALDGAKAGLEQINVASDNVAIAKTGVEQSRAALEAARVTLLQAKDGESLAERMRDNMNIYSPVDGVVEEQLAEVGQSVGANVAVLRLTTSSALYFEAQVSELAATSIQSGQPVMLSVDALQGNRANVYEKQQASTIVGNVERVVPVVDDNSRNFTVRVVVPESTSLFQGMFARGQITVAAHQNAIAIPKSTLLEKEGERYVFIAADGKAVQRKVTLGASDGNYIQVLSGLKLGEQVVSNGQQSLKEGDLIKVIE